MIFVLNEEEVMVDTYLPRKNPIWKSMELGHVTNRDFKNFEFLNFWIPTHIVDKAYIRHKSALTKKR